MNEIGIEVKSGVRVKIIVGTEIKVEVKNWVNVITVNTKTKRIYKIQTKLKRKLTKKFTRRL